MPSNCGVGEDSESPLNSKEIKIINLKGNQSWIFTERTDMEVEAPIGWVPDVKSWLIGKDPDAEKDWRQEENGTTEDEMVGWHHWFNGHDFEQTLGNGKRQGSLARCSPWGCKESDMTEQLNRTDFQNGTKTFNEERIVWNKYCQNSSTSTCKGMKLYLLYPI